MILTAKITGVHGIRGMLKVLPYSNEPSFLLQFTDWHIKRGEETFPFVLEQGRVYQHKGLLLKFKGIENPEVGRLWVGCQLFLDRDKLPALEEGYYWGDLEGLDVYTTNGAFLGTVSHLFETPANDVLVVVNEEQEILIPYVSGHTVMDVNLEKGAMIVDWEEPDAV